MNNLTEQQKPFHKKYKLFKIIILTTTFLSSFILFALAFYYQDRLGLKARDIIIVFSMLAVFVIPITYTGFIEAKYTLLKRIFPDKKLNFKKHKSFAKSLLHFFIVILIGIALAYMENNILALCIFLTVLFGRHYVVAFKYYKDQKKLENQWQIKT